MIDEVDILAIDEQIKAKLNCTKEDIEIMETRQKEIESILSEREKEFNGKSILEEYNRELYERLYRMKHNIELNLYISDTAMLVEKYSTILQMPLKVNFMGKVTTGHNSEKRQIISEYLKIARRYDDTINLGLLDDKQAKKKLNVVTCKNCGNKREQDFEVIDGNIFVCCLCSAEQIVMKHVSSYKDIDRINLSSKYMYDRKIHFRDCINQYQGKQNCTIHQCVYDDLEKQFEAHHLLVGDNSTPKEIRFSKITKEHVAMFLKELEYTKHYENINLIHYTITGIKPDDISHLESKLINDFDILVDLYDKMFKNNIDRKNFINTQYVLFQLLTRHKHPCKPEDFTILKTIERKSFHDQVCKQLFETLGWNMVITTF